MNIQKYSEEDRLECLEIFDSNIGKFFTPSEREEFSEFLNSLSDDSDYFVCMQDNRVLVCGGFSIRENSASLSWGMVHRKFHHRGIGTLLTKYRLSKIIVNKNINLVKIDTSQHTESFYKKHGFVTTKTLKDGFGQGVDSITMELKLTRPSTTTPDLHGVSYMAATILWVTLCSQYGACYANVIHL